MILAWYDPTNHHVSTDKNDPMFTPLGQLWPLHRMPSQERKMNDFERGWKAAIDEAEQVMVKCQLIPLMTPPDHPLFQLFFALKDSVVKLRDVLPTEADL